MEFCMPVNNLKLDKVKNTNFSKKMSWTFPVGVLFLLFCNDAVANNAPRQAPHVSAAPARPAMGGGERGFANQRAFGGDARHGFGGDAQRGFGGGQRAFGGQDRGHGFADDRGHGDGRGFGHDHYAFRGRDVRHFDRADMARWRGGNWNNTCFAGRCGWWWLAAGTWYYYNQPVYPYPLIVPETTYVEPDLSDSDAPAAMVVAPPPKFRYYCSNPAGYYPQVPNCNGQYQEIPSN
jgi:hypothetical protein